MNVHYSRIPGIKFKEEHTGKCFYQFDSLPNEVRVDVAMRYFKLGRGSLLPGEEDVRKESQFDWAFLRTCLKPSFGKV